MTENKLPLDYMAIEPSRQFATSLSFSVVAESSGGELNSDYFRVVSVEGQEQVSQPFSFTISLRANERNAPPINPQDANRSFANLSKPSYSPNQSLSLVQGVGGDLLAQWAQLVIGFESYPNAMGERDGMFDVQATSSVDPLPSRYFSGIVSSVSQSAPGEYSLVMQSPLFPLTLRNRYFVHQGMNLEQIIAALIRPELSRYGKHFSVRYKITGLTATRVQDWMQAGETDFAMLQRVMKKAAVHFYFIHSENGLTLVFSNQTTSPNEVYIPGCKKGALALRYSYTDAQSLGLQQNDLFCHLAYQVQMVPQTVGTVLTRQQANWETNEVASFNSFPATADTTKANYLFYQNYSYGVDKRESEETHRQIAQQVATQQGTLTGESTSTLLSPGYTFTLSQMAINPKDTTEQDEDGKLPVTADNLMPIQFNDKTFVVTKITHKVTESTPYSGTLEATLVSNGTDSKSSEATFITPFEIQDTHQGNVLAKVLKSAVPKNPYFFEKNNFQTEITSVQYGDSSSGDSVTKLKQIGCLVQFATDEGTDISHWVALSSTSQTAPAVNSMVLVGRGDNESEIPQIQQVVSSHGEKTIQPAFWRNNSWTFNTNWGSSCSTSYGDSMSIRFGSEAKADLKTAMNIVQTAYSNPTVLGANFGGVSYDMGCSFSYSTTGKGAQGLAGASVSQGSRFSESHSEQEYSVSYNNARQSFSKSNKSVNVSYQGAFSDKVDENNLSFIKGKIPNQEIIDICNTLPDGSSYNRSHITGKTINLSGMGAEPPTADPSSITSLSYSHSIMYGDSENINEQTGDSKNTNTHNGNSTNSSMTNGNSTSKTTVNGNSSSDTNVTGNADNNSKTIGETNQNDIFIGARNNLTTSVAATNAVNTFVGATNDVSTKLSVGNSISTNIGASNSVNTFIGATNDVSTKLSLSNSISTNIGASNTVNTFIGATNDVSTKLSLSNSMNTTIGTSNSVSTFIGATNDVSTRLSMSNSVSTNIGSSSSISTNLSANTSISSTMGLDLSVSTRGGLCISVDNNAGVKIQLATGNVIIQEQEKVAAVQKGIVANMVTMAMTL